MKLRFEELTYERLDEALEVIAKVFPSHLEHVGWIYRVSLEEDNGDPTWDTRRILNYFVVIDEETDKVVATTGFYQLTEHSDDEIWMGWFAVEPEIRGKGIGRKTLEWTIGEAKRRGYDYFRLWTTDDPNEAVAQKLYESVGLKIYKEEFDEKEDCLKMYREMKL